MLDELDIRRCECEHISHTESNRRTPNGNPGHKYGVWFTTTAVVSTAYGKFRVCKDCENDCQFGAVVKEDYRKPA